MKGNIWLTEKIDGTNGVVDIESVSDADYEAALAAPQPGDIFGGPAGNIKRIRAGSRSRWLSPGKGDNFGFFGWVNEHANELYQLGEGAHHGEWYGRGIQRGYGMEGRRFALFNVGLWCDNNSQYNHFIADGQLPLPAVRGLSIVPVLYTGPWFGSSMDPLSESMRRLKHMGSTLAPNTPAEGVMLFHEASRQYFKVPFEDAHKGKQG